MFRVRSHEALEPSLIIPSTISDYQARIRTLDVLPPVEVIQIAASCNGQADQVQPMTSQATETRAACNRLWIHNLRMVVSPALKLAPVTRDTVLDVEDLIQEGNLALHDAISNYDPSRGRFYKYAEWTVMKGLYQALQQYRAGFGLKPKAAENFLFLQKMSDYLEERNYEDGIDRIPSEADLAVESRRTPGSVNAFRRVQNGTLSLEQDFSALCFVGEATVEEAEDSIQDHPSEQYVIDHTTTDTLDNFLYQELIDQIPAALATLSERERSVIRQRFGLDDGVPLSLRAVGSLHNLSQTYIRTIERSAINRLRKHFLAEHDARTAPEPLPPRSVSPRTHGQQVQPVVVPKIRKPAGADIVDPNYVTLGLSVVVTEGVDTAAEDAPTIMSLLEDSWIDDMAEKDLGNVLDQLVVQQMLSSLSPRHRDIIERYYGLVGDPMTIEELSHLYQRSLSNTYYHREVALTRIRTQLPITAK